MSRMLEAVLFTRLVRFVGSLSTALLPAVSGAQAAERLVGSVFVDSATTPAIGADVFLTFARTFEVRAAQTDSAGRFEFRIADGVGDYLVVVSFPGFQTARTRVTRAGTSDSMSTTVRLQRAVTTIDALTVSATRRRPVSVDRSLGARGGASEQMLNSATGWVAAGESGDLLQLAALTPTVSVGPGGVSALGLDASQSRTTMNGLPINFSSLPRDLRQRVRVGTSAFDPAVGGFSGALVSVEIRNGGVTTNPVGRLSLDGTAALWGNSSLQGAPGGRSRAVASFASSGEWAPGRWAYNGGGSVTVDQSSIETIGISSNPLLSAAGISVAELGDLARRTESSGLVAPSGASRTAGIRSVDGLLRVDRLLGGGDLVGLLVGGNVQQRLGVGLSPYAVESRERRGTDVSAFVQLAARQHYRENSELEWRTGLTVSDRSEHALDELPAIDVRLASLATGEVLGSAQLGGSGEGARLSRHYTWESSAQLERVFDTGPLRAHQLKFFTQAQLESASAEVRAGSGRFGVQSTLDLATGDATSFVRPLAGTTREGDALNVAIGVGDLWRLNRFFALQLGVRADMSGPLSSVSPLLDGGVSLPAAPATRRSLLTPAVSPRVGFSWSYRKEKTEGASLGNSLLGDIAFPADGIIRGGIGLFRSYWSPAQAMAVDTWRADARAQQLVCGGINSPRLYTPASSGTLPTACTDGSIGANAAPNVSYLPDTFELPAAWRANLGWSRELLGVALDLNGQWSLAHGQPNFRDRNLPAVPFFALAEEQGRAVYRAPSTIFAASGGASTALARPQPAIGALVERGADAIVSARQLSLSLSPGVGRGRYLRATTSYTLSDTRGNGYAASSIDDLQSQRTRATEHTPRWRSVVEFRAMSRQWSFNSVFSLDAGARYSPMVAGDINGDGRSSNDLAYIPLSSAPGALSSAIDGLIDHGGPASRCLQRQRGQIAAQGSCVAPANGRLDLSLTWLPMQPAILTRSGGRAR